MATLTFKGARRKGDADRTWNQFEIGKYLAQCDRDTERRHLKRRAEATRFAQEPVSVGLTNELLNSRFPLADQKILAQSWDLPVMLELLSTIVGFGGIRQHFD